MSCEKSLPNELTATLDGVSAVSFRFWPVRALSLCWVRTPTNPLLVTVRTAELGGTPFTDAWIVVVPGATADARPVVLMIVATDGVKEVHGAWLVRFWVLPWL